MDAYHYDAKDFALLLLQKHFPERTDRESAVMLDFLRAHYSEFTAVDFSVRVGQGATPDAETPEATRRQFAFVSRKKIDILAWKEAQPVIIEVKVDVTPAALGQILTYRHLFLEERPDALEPELMVVGRTSDDDTLRSLAAHGIQVELYTTPDTRPLPQASGV